MLCRVYRGDDPQPQGPSASFVCSEGEAKVSGVAAYEMGSIWTSSQEQPLTAGPSVEQAQD